MMRAKKLVAVLATVAFVCHETSARMNDPKEAEQLVSAETFSSSSATEASQPDETKSLRAAVIDTATATADTAEERTPEKIAEVALGGLVHGPGGARLSEILSDKNLEIMRRLTKSVSKKPSEAEVDKIIAEAYEEVLSAYQIYLFFSGHEALKHITLQHVRNAALNKRMVKHEEKINDLFLHRHDAKEVESKTRLGGKRAEKEVESIRRTIEEWPEKYGEKLDSLDEILLKDADPHTFVQDVMSTTSPDFKERLEHFISQRIEQHNEIKTKVDELLADQASLPTIFIGTLAAFDKELSNGEKKYVRLYVNRRVEDYVMEAMRGWSEKGKSMIEIKALLKAYPFRIPENGVKHYIDKYRAQEKMVSLILDSFN